MLLLYGIGLISCRCTDVDFSEAAERAVGPPGQADDRRIAPASGLRSQYYVPTGAARADGEEGVAGLRVSLDVAREDALEAEVVRSAREVGRVGDGERRKGGSLRAERSGQLLCKVHGVAHRPSVSAREDPPAVPECTKEELGRLFELRQHGGVALQAGQRVGGRIQAGVDVLAHLRSLGGAGFLNNGAMSAGAEPAPGRVEVDCPICGGSASTGHRDARDHVSGEVFSIHRCGECGGLFVKDPPEGSRLAEYYDTPVGALMHSRPSALFAALRARRLWADVRPLLELTGPNPRIADLGTGDGHLASLLARRGVTVQAIDVYPPELWSIDDVPYRRYVPGRLQPGDLSVADAPPDAVVMRHVLEHVPDPAGTLTTIHKAGALHVLVLVPNADSWFASRFGERWYYWDPPRHLTFFTLRTLERLAERCGFRIAFDRHYGLDELATSAYRALLLRRLEGKGRWLEDQLARVVQPTGLVAGAASVLAAPVASTVCHVVLEANGR